MSLAFYAHLSEQLAQTKADGLYKQERVITSAQSAAIEVGEQEVINFCANNYLGLAKFRENPRPRSGRSGKVILDWT